MAMYLWSLGAIFFIFGPEGFAQVAYPKCEKCTEGPVDQKAVLGNYECEHGPENDPDACFGKDEFDPTKACWEVNGNKVNPATGKKCECYKCYGDKGCEKIIEFWLAWCGIETTSNKGGACKTVEGSVKGWLRREKKAKTHDGAACGYFETPTSGYYKIAFCGKAALYPGGMSFSEYGCKVQREATCVGDGPWIYGNNKETPDETCEFLRMVCKK
jgi:hypothetical protein